MENPNKYEAYFIDNQYRISDLVRQSKSWFDRQAKILTANRLNNAEGFIRSNIENTIAILPGELYLFKYFAKHANTLPYWDMYPMVFPFKKLSNGFIGLNLHYLHYKLRIRLLDRLINIKDDKKITDMKRIQLSWNTISALSSSYYAKPCVHRYLFSQVASKIKKIPPTDWGTALMLPVESFQGSTNNKVWQKSLKTNAL